MEHTTDQIAYLAGLFDGEGSICILHSKRADCYGQTYWLEISLGNTHRGVLDWIKETFGGRVTHNAERYTLRNHRTWRWRASSANAAHVLTLILPHLRIKTEQAKLAIEFQDRVTSLRYGGKRPITAEELTWREAQRLAISNLNLRNRARD